MTAEDHITHHCHQSTTGIQGPSGHRPTKTGQSKTGNPSPGLMDLTSSAIYSQLELESMDPTTATAKVGGGGAMVWWENGSC